MMIKAVNWKRYALLPVVIPMFWLRDKMWDADNRGIGDWLDDKLAEWYENTK